LSSLSQPVLSPPARAPFLEQSLKLTTQALDIRPK
jgi:hypothetical protein